MAYNKSGFKMKNPMLLKSAKDGSPMQVNYNPAKMKSPTKFNQALVDEANDPNSDMNDKFKEIVKKAGPSMKDPMKMKSPAKRRKPKTVTEGVDSAVAEAKADHARQQRAYAAENQSANIDDLGDKAEPTKMKSPTKMGHKSPTKMGHKSPTKMGHKSPAKAMKKSPAKAMKKSPAKVNPTQTMGGAKNKPSATPKPSSNFPRFS